jgi:putative sporulation protein YtaF
VIEPFLGGVNIYGKSIVSRISKLQKYQLLIILLLAVSSNLDNLGVAISYGSRKINIPFSSNLFIAFISGSGTFLSMFVGQRMYRFLNPQLSHYLGTSIIISAGIWIFIKEIVKLIKKKAPEQHHIEKINISNKSILRKTLMILDNPFVADVDFSGHISPREGFLLAFALTVNNLANGVGAGLVGLSPVLTAIFIFIFSILTIWIGIEIGDDYTSRWFGKLTGPIAGLLLIVIGLIEICY